MREKLEKKLLKDPDNLALHNEFADWLDENDPPRGELVRLHLEMEESGLSREKRHELEIRERHLLSEHGREWIGELADFILEKPTKETSFELKAGWQVFWTRGWVTGLQLDELTMKLNKVLLHAPELRLLRRIVLIEPLNATCDYLHEWGLLDKIKELDLSYGRIGDKGALTLAGHKTIRKLESLDLTGNQITAEWIAAIAKAYPRVLIDDQTPIVVRGKSDDETDD